MDIFDVWLFYRIVYFGVVFNLFFQIYINSCAYVFSNPNRSLIELFDVFFSMRFLYVVGRLRLKYKHLVFWPKQEYVTGSDIKGLVIKTAHSRLGHTLEILVTVLL